MVRDKKNSGKLKFFRTFFRSSESPGLAKILFEYCPYFTMSGPFLRQKSSFATQIVEACKKYPDFSAAVQAFERKIFNGLQIIHQLDCVHQRICRYPLLLSSYMKHADPDSDEFRQCLGMENFRNEKKNLKTLGEIFDFRNEKKIGRNSEIYRRQSGQRRRRKNSFGTAATNSKSIRNHTAGTKIIEGRRNRKTFSKRITKSDFIAGKYPAFLDLKHKSWLIIRKKVAKSLILLNIYVFVDLWP